MAPLPRPVPDIEGPDALLACAARGDAGVLRGAASGWPALHRWTPASLRERLGQRPVPSARLRGGRLQLDVRRGVDLTTRPAADVLASIERGDGDAYLMAPLDALPPDLRAEVVLPAPCRGAAWASSKLWVSPAGAISPLHFDIANNLHAQLHGTKRFLVFERGHPLTMYPEPPWSSVPNCSRVDPEAPDLDRFPRFRDAAPLYCTLSPGDIVFLPTRTWHHVTSLATSISFNFWWANGTLAWLARAADALKRARGINR